MEQQPDFEILTKSLEGLWPSVPPIHQGAPLSQQAQQMQQMQQQYQAQMDQFQDEMRTEMQQLRNEVRDGFDSLNACIDFTNARINAPNACIDGVVVRIVATALRIDEDKNNKARRINSAITSNKQALAPLTCNRNEGAEDFPRDLKAVWELCDASITMLLNAHGLDNGGSIDE